MEIKKFIRNTALAGAVAVAGVEGVVFFQDHQEIAAQAAHIRQLERQQKLHELADGKIFDEFAKDSSLQTGIDCAIVGDLGGPQDDCNSVVDQQIEYWRQKIQDIINNPEATPTPQPVPGIGG